MKILFYFSKSKLNGQNILLLTCQDDPHSGDQHKKNQIRKKVQDLREAEVNFEVLHLGTGFDINKFYKVFLFFFHLFIYIDTNN